VISGCCVVVALQSCVHVVWIFACFSLACRCVVSVEMLMISFVFESERKECCTAGVCCARQHKAQFKQNATDTLGQRKFNSRRHSESVARASIVPTWESYTSIRRNLAIVKTIRSLSGASWSQQTHHSAQKDPHLIQPTHTCEQRLSHSTRTIHGACYHTTIESIHKKRSSSSAFSSQPCFGGLSRSMFLLWGQWGMNPEPKNARNVPPDRRYTG
jgi:hypothetical protein